jgi:hypothetical protein
MGGEETLTGVKGQEFFSLIIVPEPVRHSPQGDGVSPPIIVPESP